MIDQRLVERLMISVNEANSRCCPHTLHENMDVKEISDRMFAVKYCAERLVENIAAQAPELQQLVNQFKETRAALDKTRADLKEASRELVRVQNELYAKEQQVDKVGRDLMKKQAALAKMMEAKGEPEMKARSQGVNSKNLTRPSYRTGSPNQAIRPAGVAQLGVAQGSHVMEPSRELPYRGIPMKAGAAIASKLGNELVNNVGAGGPGKGRTTYGQGSQAQHGPVAGARRSPGRSLDERS